MPFNDGAFAGQSKHLSIEAMHSPPHYDKARIAVRFDNTARRLIHMLKYQDQQHIAPQIAKFMLNSARDILPHTSSKLNGDSPDPVICPVPLFHWRYFVRRFNQADLLAINIAKLSGLDYFPKLVKRSKYTKTQVGLNRKDRRKNVKNAFTITPKWQKIAQNRPIIIVDDVITTGATVDEIAKCLKNAGLGPIYILAFAKVIQLKVI